MGDQHLISLCLAPKQGLSNAEKTYLAQASRSTKNNPDPPLHQSRTSGKNHAPIPPPTLHRNWPNVLSQPGANQILVCCFLQTCLYQLVCISVVSGEINLIKIYRWVQRLVMVQSFWAALSIYPIKTTFNNIFKNISHLGFYCCYMHSSTNKCW